MAQAEGTATVIELNPTAVLRELGITPEINRAAGFAPINTALATFAWLGMMRGRAAHSYTDKKVRVWRLGHEVAESEHCASVRSRATQAHQPVKPAGLPTPSDRMGTEKGAATGRRAM